jgi:hypothetical protein
VWEVTELWVAVFDSSEVLEEAFYEGCPGFLRLVRFYRVIDGSIAVLDLSERAGAGLGVAVLVCPSLLVLPQPVSGFGWRGLEACWQ